MTDPVLNATDPKANGKPRVTIVDLHQLLHLQRAAARGDAQSRFLAHAAIAVTQIVCNAPTYRPIRCTCCLHKTIISGDSYRIGIVMLGVPDPTIGLAFIVCDRCGKGYGRIDLAVARTVRRWLLAPDRTPDGGGQT